MRIPRRLDISQPFTRSGVQAAQEKKGQGPQDEQEVHHGRFT
jgi:hypothetical protein